MIMKAGMFLSAGFQCCFKELFQPDLNVRQVACEANVYHEAPRASSWKLGLPASPDAAHCTGQPRRPCSTPSMGLSLKSQPRWAEWSESTDDAGDDQEGVAHVEATSRPALAPATPRCTPSLNARLPALAPARELSVCHGHALVPEARVEVPLQPKSRLGVLRSEPRPSRLAMLHRDSDPSVEYASGLGRPRSTPRCTVGQPHSLSAAASSSSSQLARLPSPAEDQPLSAEEPLAHSSWDLLSALDQPLSAEEPLAASSSEPFSALSRPREALPPSLGRGCGSPLSSRGSGSARGGAILLHLPALAIGGMGNERRPSCTCRDLLS